MNLPAAAAPVRGEDDTVQLFLASTLYGAATLAAAVDAGAFGDGAARRVLLVTTNTPTPETSTPLDRAPGFAPLAARFDEVLDWNATIHPQHPSAWAPQPDDTPIWERLLRDRWRLGDAPVRLVVESIQGNPARALVDVFADSTVDIYADGLMSYGPTRVKIPGGVGGRVARLLHLDLVPGLTPLLLAEHGVIAEPIPSAAFTAVLAEISAESPADPPVGPGPALILGQYLAALGILTPEEEDRLHHRMLTGVLAAGHRSVIFKPHPSAPAGSIETLAETAADHGAELAVVDTPVLAETLFAKARPSLVVGCFSTALFTAAVFHGLPVARVGTDLLLQRLTPYQNSNRIPVTVVDSLLPDLEASGFAAGALDLSPARVGEVAALITAVGYCMQSQNRPDLREAAAAYLAELPGSLIPRYFRRRRLTVLGLPGGVQGRAVIPRNRLTRGAMRTAKALVRKGKALKGSGAEGLADER
ncbi:polysialyltransferase family glycosyltransferase [Phytomonospora sp. NPDC050363]|uniref:polysialyltransferase family glycosyltransferase n=1 Tax=Phytomonospora sp. NPDC050363 TaxID=3155642 RepID=UPI0033F6D72E